MSKFSKKFFLMALVASLVLTLIACGGEDPEENHSHEDPVITEIEIIDRDEDEVVADSHDGHWHGGLPALEANGNRLSLGARFLDQNDEPVDVDYDHHSFEARIVDGHDDDLIEIESHGDHIHLRPGASPGTTQLIFELHHHDEVVFESPAITVTVTDGTEEFGPAPTVTDMELLNRADDPHSVAAYTHDGHWDGALPAMETGGDHLSLGGRFFDDHGHDLELVRADYERENGPFQLEAVFASGADEIIEIQSHSDHIHLRPGTDAGTTQVIFELYYDGDLIYESPAIDVVVEAAGA